ncbi:MAG TPA: Clp protease N-terminal domain-containing protein [Ktedonobacteraceae bacterium]
MVYRLKPVSKETERSLELARGEALHYHHPYIGSEHLLLVLLRERTGRVAVLLERLQINEQVLLPEVQALVQADIPARIRAKRYVPTTIKFLRLFIKPRFRLTRRAQRVIELAYEEARREGHPVIEPEHLFWGILCENENATGQLLQSKGLDVEQVHDAMVNM